MNSKGVIWVSLVAAGLLTGCGQGFKSSRALEPLALCSNCGDSNPDPGADSRWEKVDLEGTVSAGPFGTHKVIELDPINNTIIIRIPVPGNLFGGGMIAFPIPQVPGAKIGMEQDPVSGQYYLAASIPLQYLVKGVQLAQPARLPSGQPLPGVPGGELPRLGLNILGKTQTFLFLGKGAVAVFVPTPQFSKYLILDMTFPIKNQNQRKTIGYFAVVASTPKDAGGFFLSVVLPAEVQKIIDSIIP